MVIIDVKQAAKQSKLKKQQCLADEQLQQNKQQWQQIVQLISSRNNLSIEQFLIGSKINGLYYVPDFITEEEHDAIVNFIVTADKQWVQGEGRRISNWGGQPYRQNVTEELPPFLQSVIQGLVQIGAHEEHLAPNHQSAGGRTHDAERFHAQETKKKKEI
eukprot:TRINITY_DN4478_c0_g1_i1.p1 TRINITY_DN4478_c0_g1~~TRINITY_DN4478_c0_g1_i1.p1  ORF type:complete len:160 (-),score=16.61 TRINITY_DN4478_c0_g1_i1:28-507(-)